MVPEAATNNIEDEGCFVYLIPFVLHYTMTSEEGGCNTPLSPATDGVWRNSWRKRLDCHCTWVAGICFIFAPCFCDVRREIREEFVSFEWYVLERRWNDIWSFNDFWKGAAMWRRIKWLETSQDMKAILQSFTSVPLQTWNRLFSRKKGAELDPWF